jgi:hypothetical protein
LRDFSNSITRSIRLRVEKLKLRGDLALNPPIFRPIEGGRRGRPVNNSKTIKRGEILFKEHDPIDKMYMIKSGRVSLYLERSGKKIEVEKLLSSQILGEQALFSNARHTFTAEAEATCQVMEVPVPLMKTQMDNSSPGMKLLTRSLVEGLKQTRTQIRSMKMEQDNSPCPQIIIPKLFSIINLVARHIGKDNEKGRTVVPWGSLKIFTNRMFLESHQRMTTCLELLTKLGYAEMHFKKNDDGEDELHELEFKGLQVIEDFCEFYQYNLYKGGKAEIIYVDKLALQVANLLVGFSKDKELDHRGAVALEYDALLKDIKSEYKMDLKTTHLDLLEKKGLFTQRITKGDAVFLSFDKNEFVKTVEFWKIIYEIDQWNEVGFIDKKDSLAISQEEAGSSDCPECSEKVAENQNFCPNCGFKLAA